MALETTEKDIDIALKKLAITPKGGDHCKTPRTCYSHFKPKFFAAIDLIREKKRQPDINAIYEHIMKSKASNADQDLVKTNMGEFTKQKVIVIKEICHGIDFYYKSSTAKQSLDFTIIRPSSSKSNNISNDKLNP